MESEPLQECHCKMDGFNCFHPESLNRKFQNLILYFVKRQVQRRYQSSLDVEQIANDSMHDFIVSVTLADDPFALDLVGLCRVITVRKAIQAVRSADRLKRICPSKLEQNVWEVEAREKRIDSCPVTVAIANDLLDAVLRSLCLRQQAILNKRMDGWSVDQIAESTNVSAKTVRREIILIAAIVRTTRTEFDGDTKFEWSEKNSTYTVEISLQCQKSAKIGTR